MELFCKRPNIMHGAITKIVANHFKQWETIEGNPDEVMSVLHDKIFSILVSQFGEQNLFGEIKKLDDDIVEIIEDRIRIIRRSAKFRKAERAYYQESTVTARTEESSEEFARMVIALPLNQQIAIIAQGIQNHKSVSPNQYLYLANTEKGEGEFYRLHTHYNTILAKLKKNYGIDWESLKFSLNDDNPLPDINFDDEE